MRACASTVCRSLDRLSSCAQFRARVARRSCRSRSARCVPNLGALMRQIIKDYVELAARHLTFSEPIYEFGALQVEGQEGFANLRPFFSGREYIGTDMRPGLGVDRVLDLHKLDLPDNSVGSVLILDTLEHVEF